MKLRIEHHRTFVDEASSEELAVIKKATKIYVPQFRPAPGAPPFTLLNLYYKEDKSFPTGYLEQVKKKLVKEAIKVETKDNRIYPKGTMKFYLDDENRFDALAHQAEALPLIYANPVGIVSAATGSGKSFLIEEVVNKFKSKTLIIVPTQSIQNQLYQSMVKLFGKKHVSFKAPKREDDPPEDVDLEVLEEERKNVLGSDDDLNYLWESKKKNLPTTGKKNVLGSDSTIDESHLYKKGKVLGSDYIEDFHGDKVEPESKYQKAKGLTDKLKMKIEAQRQKQYEKMKKLRWGQKPKSLKSKKVHPGADITILCFQSLPQTSLNFLKSVECVILDECHHSSAETIREALDVMEKAAYRYGFSATPWRDKSHDHKLLLAALGDKIIYELSGKEAVDRGIIAKPRYLIMVAPKPDEFLQKYRNWRVLVDKGIVGNVTRNKSIVNKAIELMENNHNVFICIDEIAHGEILRDRFKDMGVEVLMVHGQQNKKINNKHVETIGKNDGPLISIGTMAVGEGTNMPNITAVILAGYGKASTRFLQRIGRGTRIVDGKTEVIVIDLEDWFNPTLMKHSKARQKTFKDYFEID